MKDKGEITHIRRRILTALAKYKFLTAPQMERLKVGHRNTIYPELVKLREWGFTEHVRYTDPSFVKYPDWHFLTPKGAKLYVESDKGLTLDMVKYPKSLSSIAKNDYLHRVNCIETQISYDEWIGANGFESEFFDLYFDTIGSNRNQEKGGALRPKTRLELGYGNFADPDGILLYSTGQKRRLFILEVFRGNDSGRVVKQVRYIRDAIENGIAAAKYGLKLPERALLTFDHAPNMTASIERLRNDPDFYAEGVEDYFFFALAKDVHQDFGNGWIKLTGEQVNLATI